MLVMRNNVKFKSLKLQLYENINYVGTTPHNRHLFCMYVCMLFVCWFSIAVVAAVFYVSFLCCLGYLLQFV